MNLLSKVFVGALSFIAINATAKDNNQFDYFGVSIHNNHYDELEFSPGVVTRELAPLKYKTHTSATGFRGFIGHQFNRYFAVEAGITSFGKANFSVTEKVNGADGKLESNTVYSGDFKTLAGDIRVIGTLPLSDSFFVKAHVGALAWDNELTRLSQNNDQLFVQKVSDSGVSLTTGIGLGYGFNNAAAISLDFEKTEIADIASKSLGLAILLRF